MLVVWSMLSWYVTRMTRAVVLFISIIIINQIKKRFKEKAANPNKKSAGSSGSKGGGGGGGVNTNN